jgi:putative ABC transport system permease protein
MQVFEALRTAFSALNAHKMRSLLTMLGIIIGVGAVVGMLAMGNGFQQYLDDQFAQLGVGTFYIAPFVDSNEIDAITSVQLTAADARAIAEPGQIPLVEAVTVELGGNATVLARQQRFNYGVRAVSPNLFAVNNYDLAAGRFFTADEDEQRLRVAVLGKNVAETIFGSRSAAVGQRVLLNGVGFEVVGVLDVEAGQISIGTDPAEAIFLPYQTAAARLYRNRINPDRNVDTIAVKVREPERIDEVIADVTLLLRERHRLTYQDNDFTIINPDQFAQQAGAIIGGFNAFLGTVAGISLLVGGIGIMNIMLVSVTERTREIGLRKAVGARRWDIMLQFLIEALMLCLLGSALGVGLGYLLSFAGTFVLVSLFQAEGATAFVTMGAILLASGIAAAIGIMFGFFPALRAANLNPIEALRSE